MKLIKKVSVVLLLAVGSICLVAPTYGLLNKDRYNALGGFYVHSSLKDITFFSLVFGFPTTAAGLSLMWELGKEERKKKEKEERDRDRLQSTFFRLIEAGNGYITVFQFAMEAQLTATAVKQYLDEKAKEFGATFDVSNDGVISYYFPGVSTSYIAVSSSTTAVDTNHFVIILENSGKNKIAVIKVIRELIGLDLKEAKDLVETTPTVIKRNLTRLIAEDIKRQLEEVGAKVAIL